MNKDTEVVGSELISCEWSEDYNYNDDEIYEYARNINILNYQKIIYEEWLPLVIGKKIIKRYSKSKLNNNEKFEVSDSILLSNPSWCYS